MDGWSDGSGLVESHTLKTAVSRALFQAILIAGAVLPTQGQSEVYQWTDDHGIVHFSDSNVPSRFAASAAVLRGRRAPTPGKTAGSPETVPMIVLDGKKYVRVFLEGRRSREVMMLVDTGAQISLVDEAVAGDLRLEFVSEAEILGVTGTAHGWIGRLRRLRLDDLELTSLRIMVGPQRGLNLLGMDVLDRLELTVGADALEVR